MESAKEHSKDQDLFNNSEIKLSSDLIFSSNEASHTYYRNSDKRFKSFKKINIRLPFKLGVPKW